MALLFLRGVVAPVIVFPWCGCTLHPSTDRKKHTFQITSLIFSLGAIIDPLNGPLFSFSSWVLFQPFFCSTAVQIFSFFQWCFLYFFGWVFIFSLPLSPITSRLSKFYFPCGVFFSIFQATIFIFFLNPSHSHSFFLLWLSFSFLSPSLSNHQPIVKIFLSLMVHFFPLPYVCFSFFFFTGAAVLFKACSFYYPEHTPTPRLCTCWSHFFPLAKTSYGSLFFLS